MFHERLDINKWTSIFSLQRLRDEDSDPSGRSITSPDDIAIVEQIRAEVLGRELPSEKLPTDVFVFSEGEPARREITKVGGLPYWPKDKVWPERDGKPLTFIAQFNFMDSRDIIDQLPGDMLLMFGTQDAVRFMDSSLLYFEWINVSEVNLVSSNDIPAVELEVNPFYGSIHRTYDFPKSMDKFDNYKQSYLLDTIEGTKIGGAPRWIQWHEELPGRFLCALGSIHPSIREFPFINHPKPFETWFDKGLKWGDVGCVFMFIDQRGQVHSTIQCY